MVEALMAFDPLTEGLSFAHAVVDKIWPDAEKKDERAAQLAQMLSERDAKRDADQAAINKIEDASSSLFVAGWRPFVGWSCGASYAYTFVIQPFLIFVLTAAQVHMDIAQLPVLDMGELGVVLFGMLGLGAMRSWEKVKVGAGK